VEMYFLSRQSYYWSDNFQKIFHKTSVKIAKFNKRLNIYQAGRGLPILNSLNLFRIHANSIFSDNYTPNVTASARTSLLVT
jgi:hypothetical protein